MKKVRIHFQCKKCSQVISHTIYHLENYHKFNPHELFMMEEKEPEKFKKFIEAHYTRTDQQLSSYLSKQRIK